MSKLLREIASFAFMASTAVALPAAIVYSTLPISEEKLPRRVMELCVLNDRSAPMPQAVMDGALRIAQRDYREHGVDIVVVERGVYPSHSPQDIFDYSNDEGTPPHPNLACSRSHTAVALFSGLMATSAGFSRTDQSIIGVFYNRPSTLRISNVVEHEIGHQLGLRHRSIDDESHMRETIIGPPTQWTDAMSADLRLQREALYRGEHADIERSTKPKQ